MPGDGAGEVALVGVAVTDGELRQGQSPKITHRRLEADDIRCLLRGKPHVLSELRRDMSMAPARMGDQLADLHLATAGPDAAPHPFHPGRHVNRTAPQHLLQFSLHQAESLGPGGRGCQSLGKDVNPRNEVLRGDDVTRHLSSWHAQDTTDPDRMQVGLHAILTPGEAGGGMAR